MPLVSNIERSIRNLEGFDVRIVTTDGVNVRSDRNLSRGYNNYERRAAGTASVEEWKRSRFRKNFVGLEVEVLFGDGTPAHGRTSLSSVRDSYS